MPRRVTDFRPVPTEDCGWCVVAWVVVLAPAGLVAWAWALRAVIRWALGEPG